MRIHHEGFKILGAAFLGAAAIWFVLEYLLTLPYWAEVGILLVILLKLAFVAQFFRNPLRQSPQNDNLIIAPADGKVVVIEQTVDDEYLGTNCTQISIFMSPFNVHVNRAPVRGRVRYVRYHAGKFLVAWYPKSSTENERNTVVFEAANGALVLTRQIAGAVARRIRCYVRPEQFVNAGAEFGFIKFGSRVDILLPTSAIVEVKLGQQVRGGETILARWS